MADSVQPPFNVWRPGGPAYQNLQRVANDIRRFSLGALTLTEPAALVELTGSVINGLTRFEHELRPILLKRAAGLKT